MLVFLRLLALVVAPLFLLASCGGGEPDEPEMVEATPALWEIADEDTTIYVFGTYHLLPDNVAWFAGPVREAFEASDQLVIDHLAPQDANRQLEGFAPARDGQPLSARLSPEYNERFDALIERYDIDRAAIDGADPWFAAMTLSLLEHRAIGLDDENDAEFALIRAAGEAGKFVVKREGYRDRLRFLDGLSTAVQTEMLEAAIERIETLREDHAALLESWASGDIDAFAARAQSEYDDRPELREAYLTGINTAWAGWIAERLDRPGTVFIAIDVVRLGGDGSIIEMLAARDISARRMPE
ncbi:TraB/GumN family protein [uncultured Parasphingopyxis sp.]|uniref:TraB/GumN family protein n=1 Tax=uncultured Parasphingopyxis sp. TaxID=1547918 RepID=UPI002602FF96|nr:TraB/GumN family protein [uncultured Parasphingopyxis sp.]